MELIVSKNWSQFFLSFSKRAGFIKTVWIFFVCGMEIQLKELLLNEIISIV